MIYLYNGEQIQDQFTDLKGTTYPSDWLTYATPTDFEKVGIIALTEVVPRLSNGKRYDGTYVDDLIALTRTYNVVDL
jgi:hypothetical protein